MLENKLITKVLGIGLIVLSGCRTMNAEYFKAKPIDEIRRCEDNNMRHMYCDSQFIYPAVVVKFK